jgi:hypothetical protein
MSKTDSYFNPDRYATVAERVELFYERYPQGRINTELVSRVDGAITFKAVVYRDPGDTTPAATGWASEKEGDSDINTVACLENTETSAVGRATSAKSPISCESATAPRGCACIACVSDFVASPSATSRR